MRLPWWARAKAGRYEEVWSQGKREKMHTARAVWRLLSSVLRPRVSKAKESYCVHSHWALTLIMDAGYYQAIADGYWRLLRADLSMSNVSLHRRPLIEVKASA